MNYSVNFKFCGGCNPRYDRKEVYNCVIEKLQNELSKGTGSEDTALIILNGCQGGCIRTGKFLKDFSSIVNVQYYLVDYLNLDSLDITSWIMNSISKK